MTPSNLSERARALGEWLRGREELCRRHAAEQPDQLAFADNAEAYQFRAETVESLLAEMRAEREWQPMETAPKDGTSILIAMKTILPLRAGDFAGLRFVARHPGVCSNGFDLGWNFAAPVGMGGFPDEWIAGWVPLPSPPNVEPST